MPNSWSVTGGSTTSQQFYRLLAWVKASERRQEILVALNENPKNTTDFAEKWGVTLEAVRYHLNQLMEGGPYPDCAALVQVLTPERDRYRLYGLTEEGSKMTEYL